MATAFEQAVKISEVLSPGEKHYAQLVAEQFLDIHLSGLAPSPLAVHAKLPPTQLLHGLLSHLSRAELERFIATVTLMPKDKDPSSKDQATVAAEEEVVAPNMPASTTPLVQSGQEIKANEVAALAASLQNNQSEVPSGSYDAVPEQSSGPTRRGANITSSPHESGKNDASSTTTVAAQDTKRNPHHHKRKAQEEALTDGEEQSQSSSLRPTKSLKTRANDFASAPQAGPSGDHFQAPVLVATQLSGQAAPEVQTHGDSSSSRNSNDSGSTPGEGRRASCASTLSASSQSSRTSDGTTGDKLYGSSHDLYKGTANWDAYRYPKGTKIPMNKDVQEYYQAGTLQGKIIKDISMGMVYWLKIHAQMPQDAMPPSPHETALLVFNYLLRLERFEDNYYGPGVPLPLPAETMPQQVSLPPQVSTSQSGGHASGQSAIPQSHNKSVPARMSARNMSTPTLEDIVRWVGARTPIQFQPPMLKNNLRDFAKEVLGEQVRRNVKKPELMTMIFNNQIVANALRQAGLQIPNEYGQQVQQAQALPNSGGVSIANQAFGAHDANAQNNGSSHDNRQSQSRPQSSRGLGSPPPNRSTKPKARNVGGSMVPRAGINKTQTQARPSPLYRVPNRFLQACEHQQSHRYLHFSNMAQTPLGGINRALKNSLPPQFENGRAKNIPHVLQAQQPAYNDQPSGPSAIRGRSAANGINLDDDELVIVDEPTSHIATSTPRASSLGAIHPQNQPAQVADTVNPALSEWHKSKHGGPTTMDTFARRGGAAPVSATHGAPKSSSVGVSKERRKKPVSGATPRQRAAQLARARTAEADFAGFSMQQNALSTAHGGAVSHPVPAAQGSSFLEEQSVQNVQQDQAPFGSDDTIDLQQDDENLFNINDQHVFDPQLFQPVITSGPLHDQTDTQYNQISGQQTSTPQTNQPGHHNDYTTETGQQLDPLLWADFFENDAFYGDSA
ncbi:hypothetical protein AC579_8177 [Pseudocercospora musae]|uniref:Uncharacterized protein n=1 Tax=Pseudocercospora musae TaxID=113226 RepID=A0A139IUZ1_9PEZI|nr:hypothetical protein AC579_8177 [Pseudocercospora musae]